jgi:beta-phosphoglucomutase-like phosphatase (HAD superfamily)
MGNKKNYKLICFDVDGTIALSEPRNRDVIETLASQYGGEIKKEHWDFLAGQSEVKIWDWLNESYESFQGIEKEQFSLDCRKGYLKSSFDVAVRPGIHEIIQHFKRANLPIVAVSNSPRNLVEHSLKVTNCFDSMDHIITEDEVLAAGKSPKPDPDPYHMAFHLYECVHPSDSLIYEDSGTGINAGISSGADVIQLVDNGVKENPLATYHSHNKTELVKLAKKLVP